MRALRRLPRSTADDGAAAVEFALVVPLLLLFVFGIINFGVLFSQQLTINNAVREGARRGVVVSPAAPRTCDGILTSVQNELAGLAMSSKDVEVKITQDGWSNGSSCGSNWAKTTFGGSKNNIPCTGSLDSSTGGQGLRSIIVEARYVSTIPVSLPPFPTSMTLHSKAVYRCEFSS